jgi:hypothetical protein
MSKETENGRESVPQYVIDALEKREQSHTAILNGLLPRLEELFEGAPFYKDSLDLDVQVFVDDLLAERRKIIALERLYRLPKNLAIDALQRMRDTCKPEAMQAVRELLDRIDHPDLMRLDVYLACSSDDKARERLAEHLDDGEWFMSSGLSVADGSLFRSFVKWGLQYGRAETMHHYFMRGFRSAKSQSDRIAEYVKGTRALEDRKQEKEKSRLADLKADADFLERVMEDRGEIHPAPGLVVVPALPEGGTAWRKEITKSWKDLAGTALPLVERTDTASMIAMSSGAGSNRQTHAGIAYASAKAGVAQFVRVMGTRLGPSGIRVNAVAPGIADTPMTHDLVGDQVSAVEANIPLRRLGDPTEIATATSVSAT